MRLRRLRRSECLNIITILRSIIFLARAARLRYLGLIIISSKFQVAELSTDLFSDYGIQLPATDLFNSYKQVPFGLMMIGIRCRVSQK
jgi:hypothetical protein